VAVIGGGISGLAAAHWLDRSGCRVKLYEASTRLGGVVKTAFLEDVVVEEGPDALLSRADIIELCHSLGLGGDLVAPAVFGGHIWTRRGLRALPRGIVLGLPASPVAAVRSGLLSPWAGMRAGLEVMTPRRLAGPDVSVGKLVAERFGAGVAEGLVDPLLAGRRAGMPEDISLAAAEPAIDALARTNRSLILGLRRAVRRGEAGAPPGFLAPAGGMERLVDALRGAMRAVEIRTGTPVTSITQGTGATYAVSTTGNAPVSVDGVVIALPTHAAAPLIGPLSTAAARELAAIGYASTAVVSFVYPPGAGAPPVGGSGFLVPSARGKITAACTWYSAKWPAATPRDGALVLRAFVGRAGHEPALEWDDDRLAAAIDMELRSAMTLTRSPRTWKVSRWDRSLPEYTVGHKALVARLEKALAAHATVALCGAGYRGSGIPDCIAGAEKAAAAVRGQIPAATK